MTNDRLLEIQSELSLTIRRTMIALIVYSLFVLLTISKPDYFLVVENKGINVPFANTTVDFLSFLFVSPFILWGLVIYLHIFVGKLEAIRKKEDCQHSVYIFSFDDWLSNIVTGFIFYWLPIVVTLAVFWKMMLPSISPIFVVIPALLFSAVMVYLFSLRCKTRGSKITYAISLVLLTCMLLFILLQFFPNRSTQVGSRKLDLRGVDFTKLKLSTTSLWGADLTSSNMSGLNLESGGFSNARLIESNLSNANLKHAWMQYSFLHLADLSKSNLESAKLQGADFTGANLHSVNLKNANLSNASLASADLSNSVLTGSNLSGARLFNTNMKGVQGLTCAMLEETADWDTAIIDERLECR
jgi:uncharacterized protein YjbI with pentapeptide repeats